MKLGLASADLQLGLQAEARERLLAIEQDAQAWRITWIEADAARLLGLSLIDEGDREEARAHLVAAHVAGQDLRRFEEAATLHALAKLLIEETHRGLAFVCEAIAYVILASRGDSRAVSQLLQ